MEIVMTEFLDLAALQRELGMETWAMADCSVGADGMIYLLFSACVPERINGMFVDTRANTEYRGLAIAADWQDGTILGWEQYDFGVHEMNYHLYSRLGRTFCCWEQGPGATGTGVRIKTP